LSKKEGSEDPAENLPDAKRTVKAITTSKKDDQQTEYWEVNFQVGTSRICRVRLWAQ
jgi:hypothetical protein